MGLVPGCLFIILTFYLILSAAVYIGVAEEEAWWAVPREEEGVGHFPTWAWILVASLSLLLFLALGTNQTLKK